jgi:protein-tyrosine phosphatase
MSFKETSAMFIENQCLFGAFPTQFQVNELEDWGVELFVNLTNTFERRISPYSSNKQVICFPIPDRSVPENVREFCALVIKISEEIDSGKKIYIHCKAGHGRSGTLVASLLCYMYKLSPDESFRKTTEYHSTRPIHARRPKMNEYWKNKGSPQTKEQKQFVRSIFQPYRINFDTKGIHEILTFLKDEEEEVLNTHLGEIQGSNQEMFVLYRKELFARIWASIREKNLF